MDINKFFQSKVFMVIVYVFLGITVLFLVFLGGLEIGYNKARFSYKWGENYYRNFAGPRDGFMREFRGQKFMGAHGVVGSIIKINLPEIVIQGQDGVERIILIKQGTIIARHHDKIRPTDLKLNDNLVVIGSSNDGGQIEAKFIRVMPFLGTGGFSTSTTSTLSY